MKWKFKCKKCGHVFTECMRIEDVLYKGKLNITHCNVIVDIIPIRQRELQK